MSNKKYAVIDTRNNAIYHEGTEWECMRFLLENYPHLDYMKVGFNWSLGGNEDGK
ncbi:hypothetical protein Q7A53_05705 [Halobacillus rhizosphaerae]|uniref:hypothetical protein n=1 Tax=Halobacillus rhizosphaerae TaxID=3064889 RepID=UPI00398B99D9